MCPCCVLTKNVWPNSISLAYMNLMLGAVFADQYCAPNNLEFKDAIYLPLD